MEAIYVLLWVLVSAVGYFGYLHVQRELAKKRMMRRLLESDKDFGTCGHRREVLYMALANWDRLYSSPALYWIDGELYVGKVDNPLFHFLVTLDSPNKVRAGSWICRKEREEAIELMKLYKL